MPNQVANYLLEIIKTGGPIALWGIGIWMTVNLIKIAIVSWLAYLAVKQVSASVVQYHKDTLTNKVLRVTLLSEEVSKKFSDSLDSFSLESTNILKEIEKQLNELKKESIKI